MHPHPTTAGARLTAAAGAGVTAAILAGAAAAPAQAGNATLQVPFTCGTTVNAQVRSDHSPAGSVDFNGTDGGDTDYGMTVVASGSGRVVFSGQAGVSPGDSRGRTVAIAHAGEITTSYSHLSKRAVKEGQRVRRGQKIGEVGASADGSDQGTATHLHYEQVRGGSWPGTVRQSRFGGKLPAAWYAPATINDTHAVKSRNCGGGGNGDDGGGNDGGGNDGGGNDGGGGPGVALPKGFAKRTAATVQTDNGLRVSARAKPTTASKLVRRFVGGDRVRIVCQKRGRRVSGKFGTSRLWDLVDLGGGRGAYVTDTYVFTGSDGRVARRCPS